MLIRVYNYNTMDKVKVFEAHTDYIRCACLPASMGGWMDGLPAQARPQAASRIEGGPVAAAAWVDDGWVTATAASRKLQAGPTEER
jgi:hypothetical protein